MEIPIKNEIKNHTSVFSPLFLLLLLVGIGYFFYFNFFRNPCGTPVHYAIGTVDSRFKISSNEALKVAEDAAERWNVKSGENLLVYDQNAPVKINLVYDERQAKVDQINSAVGSLNSTGNAIDSFRKKVEADISQYQKDLATYNSTVEYWNANSGAPTDIYAQLQGTKKSLDQRRQTINASTSLLNQQINAQNSNIGELNSQLDADRNKLITEGLYYTAEKKIDIFTFGNSEELRLVLMHELGHALSLEHDTLPESIMYPVLGGQNLDNPTLSSEDLNMFYQTCQTVRGGFMTVLRNIFNRAPATSS